MSLLQDRRYKETSPEKTVKRIKDILKKYGVEVEENWTKKSSVGTYSLRLCIKGTNLGQNGKGMTKEYAMASAYAEFLERYQNGILVFRQEKPTKELPFVYSADEKKFSVEELVLQNDSFMEKIYDNNKDTNENKMKLIKEIFGNNKDIICLPHYSVRDKKVIYIPHVLSCHLIGTNGMCAGNSPEEAIIEGISEILERYVTMQLIYKKVSLPEIPNDYLENFPKVKEMMGKLQKKEGYVCKLLDCSFGGKYPVAGLVIFQKNTGRFGFKLGAHPDYGIAMERCFTEAAQGMDIYDYAKGCLFDFKNEDIFKDENVREFVNSNVATLPYEIFSKEKTYSFTKMKDVSKLSNKQILNYLVENLLENGHDVLIRDVSTLGFPSYRIIIPGMTEVTHSKMAGRFAMFEKMEYVLKDLKNINMDNIEEVIKIMETEIYEVGFNSLYNFINVKDIGLLHGENIGSGAKYFLAMCYLMNGMIKEAEKLLEEILFVANQFMPQDIKTIMIRAVYYYVSGMNKLHNHKKVIEYLDILFDKEVVNVIDYQFKDIKQILIRHYDIQKKDYVENDDEYYLPFMETLRKAQKDNIINQERLSNLFYEINTKKLSLNY